jgi:hypothetical protein
LSQGRLGLADERHMAYFDLVRRRPSKALPVLLCSIFAAVALGLLIGDKLVPAMLQLSTRH